MRRRPGGGLAARVHMPGRDVDLLLSTVGRGPLTRHLPMPRRRFDARYGSITAYRTRRRDKLYLVALPDPAGPALGRSVDDVGAGARFRLSVRRGRCESPAATVSLERALPPHIDAALAFDPVRNALPDLHPSGLVHGSRALAYRLSQHWRGADPAGGDPAAVARTLAHD